MFTLLLPPGVAVAESATPDAPDWTSGLFREEERRISNAVPRRRREFTAGRNLARRALSQLGVSARAIEVGTSGEPVFPFGISGSITHTHDYCAAAATHIDVVRAIGIDAEVLRPLPDEVRSYVLSAGEARREPLGDVFFGTRLFCAKEAFYKAFFQVCGVFADFHEVAVTLPHAVEGSATTVFEARVQLASASHPCECVFRGRLGQDEFRIYAAVALTEPDALAIRMHAASVDRAAPGA